MPEDSQQPNLQPIPPQESLAGGDKVIQPLDPNLKVDSTPTQPPIQPGTAISARALQPRPSPSSIYPVATDGKPATNSETFNATETKEATNEPLSFSKGYSIGGTIFWLQFLAGLVLGLILQGILSTVLHNTSLAVFATVMILYYLTAFFIVAYIPYSTLKSNNIDEPFWETVFGIAIESIIIAGLFKLVIGWLIRSVVEHAINYSLQHNSLTSLRAVSIALYIGFFVGAYFLTKLAWGTTFLLSGKIKNKMIIRAIGVGVIALFLGSIVYHYLTLHNSKLISSQPKVSIPQQKLGASSFTEPITGYQISLPAGWLGGELPSVGKTTLASWYYQNNAMDELRIATVSPSSGSLQSDVQKWQSTEQASNSDYKLISSTAITVNGIPAYYITDTWTAKTLKPQMVTDQVLIADNKGIEYIVDGNSYSQYALSFTDVLKQSLMSFKPKQ